MPHLIALKNLITACGKNGQVFAIGSAPDNARVDLNLDTKEAIYAFIAQWDPEVPTFINAMPWGHDRDQSKPATVYAFNFYSGPKYGYIAFMMSNQTGKWLIKSFKKNDRPDPKALPSEDQLLELKKKFEGK